MNRVDYKIFVLKYASVQKYNQIRLALAVFASTKLALNYIKQARCN